MFRQPQFVQALQHGCHGSGRHAHVFRDVAGADDGQFFLQPKDAFGVFFNTLGKFVFFPVSIGGTARRRNPQQ